MKLTSYEEKVLPVAAVGCVMANLPALWYILKGDWTPSDLCLGVGFVLGWGLYVMVIVAHIISEEVVILERKRVLSALPDHLREEAAKVWWGGAGNTDPEASDFGDV